MKYANVKETGSSNTLVRDGIVYKEVGGHYFRVIGVLKSVKAEGLVPLLDIPQMSDYQWQKGALESRLAHPELYAETENVDATVARLRKWLAEHEEG